MFADAAIGWSVVSTIRSQGRGQAARNSALEQFAYTKGLWETHGVPELWCSGLSRNGQRIELRWLADVLNRIGVGLVEQSISVEDIFYEPTSVMDIARGSDLEFLLPSHSIDAIDLYEPCEVFQLTPVTAVLVVEWISPLGG